MGRNTLGERMELKTLIKEMENNSQQARLAKIASMIEGNTILDAGAGAGQLKKHIQADKTYEALEAEQSFVNHLRASAIRATQGNITQIPYADKTFDTVIAAEILEHLENPGLGLSECMRVAKDQVIITLPRANNWEEHAWTFTWETENEWLFINAKRNPNWKTEHQEKLKQ